MSVAAADGRSRGHRRWLGLAALLLLAGVALGWSARTLLAPPAPLPEGREYAVTTVEDGVIERSLNLNVAAQWSGGTDVINGATGTLTQRVAPDGRSVATGAVLYTVDLAPVVVADGAVPAFRALGRGIDGADVAQLQGLLRATGVRTAAPDGRFDRRTEAEVREWQRRTGIPVTGDVPLGRLVFAPGLPAILAWSDDARVGAGVGPGVAIARLLPPQPIVEMNLPANQVAVVRAGMPVTIDAGSGVVWRGRLGPISPPGDDGSALAQVVPDEGAVSVCGDECAVIPPTGAGALPATVVVVPEQRGTIVPVAALVVGTAGTSALTTESGGSVPVTVVATAAGRALVTGVDPGVAIRVPGGSSGAAASRPVAGE